MSLLFIATMAPECHELATCSGFWGFVRLRVEGLEFAVLGGWGVEGLEIRVLAVVGLRVQGLEIRVLAVVG